MRIPGDPIEGKVKPQKMRLDKNINHVSLVSLAMQHAAGDKSVRAEKSKTWIEVSSLPVSCMTMSKSLNLYKSQP